MAALQKGFVRHPKFTALSDGAFRLWMAGWSYCQDQLTDGIIHKNALGSLGVRMRSAWITELLTVVPPYRCPLWEEQGDSYVMHDYLDWNDSRREIQDNRARLRTKVKEHRLRAKHDRGEVVSKGNEGTPPVTGSMRDPLCNPVRNPACNQVRNRLRTPPCTPLSNEGINEQRTTDIEQRPSDGGDPPPCARPPNTDTEGIDQAAGCYEQFRQRALALGRGTLPLIPRPYDAQAAIDLVTRYPDPGQRAQLVEAYLASTHRPLRAQPISMGQLAKWTAWLEDHRARAPTPESDEEFVAKALAMKGPLG